MVYVNFLSLKSKISIQPAFETQIALLLDKKKTILTKYADFANVFLKKLFKILSYKRVSINILSN